TRIRIRRPRAGPSAQRSATSGLHRVAAAQQVEKGSAHIVVVATCPDLVEQAVGRQGIQVAGGGDARHTQFALRELHPRVGMVEQVVDQVLAVEAVAGADALFGLPQQFLDRLHGGDGFGRGGSDGVEHVDHPFLPGIVVSHRLQQAVVVRPGAHDMAAEVEHGNFQQALLDQVPHISRAFDTDLSQERRRGQGPEKQQGPDRPALASTAGGGVYQTTSAIEQFRPEPIPSRATRSPFFRRPISRSLLSTIGTEAGPMLPCSPKMVRTLRGSMPMALVNAAVWTLLTWWMTNWSSSSATQPSACLAAPKVFCDSLMPSISSIRVSVTMPSRLPRHSLFHSVAARVTPPR